MGDIKVPIQESWSAEIINPVEMLHGRWCPTFPANLQGGLGSSGQGQGRTQDLEARVAREHSRQKGNLLGSEMGGRESHSRL